MSGKRVADGKIPGLLQELAWRGLLQDQTPGLAERLAKGPITGYVGFDPTAKSLQVGNLVPIMLLAHLQRTGGKPIVVVGGGTGLIGDPSGKRSERPLLSEQEVRDNVQRQRRQFEKFLDFDTGAHGAEMVDNVEWLKPLNLVEFLRDYGKHFTLSYMLQKESVKGRMEAGISYTEFSYMLLQAYDFLQLYRTRRCELQMGGSDQWGNITAGIELIRRAEGGDAHGLSAPLLTTATGTKFGKTEVGLTCWLAPPEPGIEGTTPYRFYQFWINVSDQDVEAWLKMFTLRSKDEIAALMADHARDPGARVPHRALADDLTSRVHGAAATRRVSAASGILFGQVEPAAAPAEAWELLASELGASEAHRIPAADLPLSALDVVSRQGLDASKSELRRLFKQGAININGRRVDAETPIGREQVLGGRYLWLRRGKKTDHVILIG